MLLIIDAGVAELLYPVSDFFLDMFKNELRIWKHFEK
jgi:hypothetical protein